MCDTGERTYRLHRVGLPFACTWGSVKNLQSYSGFMNWRIQPWTPTAVDDREEDHPWHRYRMISRRWMSGYREARTDELVVKVGLPGLEDSDGDIWVLAQTGSESQSSRL